MHVACIRNCACSVIWGGKKTLGTRLCGNLAASPGSRPSQSLSVSTVSTFAVSQCQVTGVLYFTMSSSTTIFRLLYVWGFLYLAKCDWIDLSYVFNNETMSWGDTTRFQHELVFEGPLKANNVTLVPYYTGYDYSSSEHAGTHLDSPVHFAEGKWSVDEIPAENLVGDAVVVNISAKAAKDRNAEVTVDDLRKWEREHGTIPVGSILFVFTGWGKYWTNYEKYFGTNTKNTSLYRFPGIHKDAATWLVNDRNIKAVGIDTPSIDYGKATSYPTHQILYAKNIYGLENVANLDQLPVTGAIVYALPMKIGRGSGAPVRILATIKKKSNEPNGVGNIWSSGLFVVVLVTLGMLAV
ncbi:uncharacterized protein LOC114527269 [Dendronephthya gigantea]|uniref:uncharacterized protein LOC114527269 n=1 Tax=Dendronephthya gigantea TaxID=151771 RepID=UPI00106AD2A9|nr:uncharacterized protein LOC114527269 [Dendronephthya gigantea]